MSADAKRTAAATERSTKHLHARRGMSTPEYMAWVGMRGRCYCQSNRWFGRYGGRGIAVCDQWRESFAAFFADMGPRPSPKHSLDRIDVNGNYEPSNCRWATKEEQNGNRTDSRLFDIDGDRMCMAAWARRYGISDDCVRRRLNRGWDIKRALSTPSRAAWPVVGGAR